MLHVREVEPLGRHVRRHQHVRLAHLECFRRILAVLLRLSTVRAHRVCSLEEEVLVDVVDVGLVLAEYERGGRCLLEALEEVDDPSLLLHILHLLDNVQVCCSRSPDVDDDRHDESGASEVLNVLGHRRREEQGLALSLKVRQDLAHLILKPHVNHPVCLVQSQQPAERELEALLAEHVHEAAGRRHHHVDSRGDDVPLLTHVDAAHSQQHAHGRVTAEAERIRVLLDDIVRLPCELARRVDAQPKRALPAHDGHLALLL
mmetsp:Transcript_24018/g.48470  ORF Transcript_24018/g.48470 Transcript_24018/m.48470 type:complete len:260 (-) Transcript_24018:1275-2054(-)